MLERGKKRGLSKSTNTLLITMLILISASIIWIVLKNPLQGTANQIDFYESELDLQIEKVNFSENFVNVTIKRNPGRGQFMGTSFVVEDDKNMEVFINKTPLAELEMKTFSLNLIKIESGKITKITISPIFKLESGEEMIGGIKDEYEITTL